MDSSSGNPESVKLGFSIGREDLPQELPIFPLRGFLVLPKLSLPLNIFEPRYLAMVNDTLATPHRLIGMIQPAPDSNEDDDSPALTKVGCAARISSCSEEAGNRYTIYVRGVTRFRIGREVAPRNGYRRVAADWGEFLGDLDGDPMQFPQGEIGELLSITEDYFEQLRLTIPKKELAKNTPEDLVNIISVISPFSNDEKQALLEVPDVGRRATLVRAFMQDALQKSSPGEATIH